MPVLEFDEPASSKLLDRAIGMNDRKAQAFGDLPLRERKFVAVRVRSADEVQPDKKLAKQMRHSRDRRPLAERKSAFPVDRRVYVRREPVHSSEVRESFGDGAQTVVRYDGERAIAERHHVMVEAFQRETVKVGEVARHVQLRELPLSALEILRARHPSVDQHQARVEALPRSYHDRVREDLARLRHCVADRLLLFRTDLRALTQLLEMDGDHRDALCNGPRELRLTQVTRVPEFKKARIYKAKAPRFCNPGESICR